MPRPLSCPGLLLALLIFLCPLVSSASNETRKDTVITAGPSWERFTNGDGTGLYHDIVKAVFGKNNVRHFYVASAQATTMVALGRADIMMCGTKADRGLMLSAHPMYENDFYALYLKDRIGPWQDLSSLAGRQLVWRETYYSQKDFPLPVQFIEVRSGESALQMVASGRADFYIDDMHLIMQSFTKTGLNPNDPRFGYAKVGQRRYFPVFADTLRGAKLREQYETRMEDLYRDGTLERFYHYWGFTLPNWTFSHP